MRRTVVELIGVVIVSFLAAGLAHAGPCAGSTGATSYAGPLCGNITGQVIITGNTWLTGNVTCKVTGAACIVFGANNISLKLNGHTITGQGEPRGSSTWGSCPSETAFERATDTNLQNNVRILGPGLIGEFREVGILITGNNSLVQNVVVSSTCREGIFMAGSHNDLEKNTVVRSSLNGNFLASIFVTGSGGHTVRGNQVGASGPAPFLTQGLGGGQGIFIGSSTPNNNNRIIGNTVTGIPGSGLWVAWASPYQPEQGNQIIGNKFFGNVGDWDIIDQNMAGSNTYSNNACEVSVGADAPKCPNLPGESND